MKRRAEAPVADWLGKSRSTNGCFVAKLGGDRQERAAREFAAQLDLQAWAWPGHPSVLLCMRFGGADGSHDNSARLVALVERPKPQTFGLGQARQ
jgi:hypothetical protein